MGSIHDILMENYVVAEGLLLAWLMQLADFEQNSVIVSYSMGFPSRLFGSGERLIGTSVHECTLMPKKEARQRAEQFLAAGKVMWPELTPPTASEVARSLIATARRSAVSGQEIERTAEGVMAAASVPGYSIGQLLTAIGDPVLPEVQLAELLLAFPDGEQLVATPEVLAGLKRIATAALSSQKYPLHPQSQEVIAAEVRALQEQYGIVSRLAVQMRRVFSQMMVVDGIFQFAARMLPGWEEPPRSAPIQLPPGESEPTEVELLSQRMAHMEIAQLCTTQVLAHTGNDPVLGLGMSPQQLGQRRLQLAEHWTEKLRDFQALHQTCRWRYSSF